MVRLVAGDGRDDGVVPAAARDWNRLGIFLREGKSVRWLEAAGGPMGLEAHIAGRMHWLRGRCMGPTLEAGLPLHTVDALMIH